MTEKRKELQAQYKERKIIGGVYVIRNTKTNRLLLEADTDLQGSKNRFAFAQATDSCVFMKLQADWKQFGSAAFAFEVLEELEKGETQSMAAFQADMGVLKEMWREKLTDKELY